MTRWRQALRLWPWLAAVTSGLLAAGSLPPFNQAWFCWIALTPLLVAVWFSGQDCPRRWLRNLLLGYVAGVVFITTAFSWLGTLGTLYENLFLHTLPLLLALYFGMYFAVWSWFAGLIRPVEAVVSATDAVEPTKTKWHEMLEKAGKPMREPAPSIPWLRSTTNLRLAFLLASAWVSLEWIRGWLFSGWGWNGLGVALHTNWPIIQIAEFTGVAGLSFVIAFGNVIAVTSARRLILETKFHRMRPHYDLTLTMSFIVGLLAFGIHATKISQASKPVRVAAVQANVAQREKFDPQFTSKIFDQFARLSDIAVRTNPPPALLLWPESAMPDPVRDENGESFRFVRDLAASTKTDLLLGTVDLEEDRAFNAALLVSKAGEQFQIYQKIHLVPFGEYIPLRRAFPLFAAAAGRWVPGDFTAGREFTLLTTTNGQVKIAPLICFEDTIGELTRHFVANGANLLVNVTNDGWFLRSAGSQQHLANAIFRCVETRRPLVRAANTGVTCFINEFGRVTQVLRDENGSTFTEGVLSGDVDVPTEGRLTLYVRHGELFAKLCACVTLIAIIVCFLLQRRGRGGSPEPPAGD